MGCSSSRQISDDAASPPARSANLGVTSGGDGNVSSQGLVGDSASIPDSALEQQRQQGNGFTADGRPNQPLHAPSPVASSPANMTHQPWTRAELGRQRDAFFDTRVTGSAEVWAAVKLVCDMLRSGNIKDAQGMLDATGLTCPTGSVVGERQTSRSGRGRRGGVYDDKGELYDVPGWIVADPADIFEEVSQDKEKAGLVAAEGLDMVEAKAEAPERHAEVDEIGEMVKVKARLSGKETDVVVSVGREQKVGVLVEKIKVKANVKSVRLILFGRMLGEGQKLSETGWAPGHVLNAFVFE